MVDIYKFELGSLNCAVINDGNITLRPTSIFFEGASPEELTKALSEHQLSSDGHTIPCSCLLVEHDEHKLLVDCGSAGELAGYDADLGYLFDGLTEIGISTEDITHVILSHGHFDHISACADDEGNATFPNARYIMARDEWQYWVHNTGADPHEVMLRVKLQGIQDQLDLVEPDAQVLDWVRVLATPGHTLHHLSVELESDGETLLCPIDVMDHPLQGQHPTWGANWDLDRKQAITSRRRILERAAEPNVIVHGFHFPFPGVGRFSFDGEVWQWESLT